MNAEKMDFNTRQETFAFNSDSNKTIMCLGHSSMVDFLFIFGILEFLGPKEWEKIFADINSKLCGKACHPRRHEVAIK